MLQNLLCLCKKKTQVVFFIFHFEQLCVLLYERPGLYVDIDQGIHKGKTQLKLLKMINEKNYLVFFLNKHSKL